MLFDRVRLAGLALAVSVLAGVSMGVAQPNLGSIVALTVAALCVALLVTGLGGSTQVASTFAVSMRDVARRPQYRRLSDPDAAGRPRPRAPGAA
jgi:hypothetical protein